MVAGFADVGDPIERPVHDAVRVAAVFEAVKVPVLMDHHGAGVFEDLGVGQKPTHVKDAVRRFGGDRRLSSGSAYQREVGDDLLFERKAVRRRPAPVVIRKPVGVFEAGTEGRRLN